MRWTAITALLALIGSAHADRLVNTPRGGKLPYGTVRGEVLGEPTIRSNRYVFVGLGLTTAFDAEIRAERVEGHGEAVSFDLSYNVNAPLTDFAPGISLGVMDALDETRDGRRVYLAITSRQSTGENLAGGIAVEWTVGFTAGARNAGFVSVSFPFSNEVRLLAEHDGIRVTAGLETQPIAGLNFRLLFRPQETLLGIQSTTRL